MQKTAKLRACARAARRLAAALLPCAAFCALRAEPRIWKAASGQEMSAEFIAVEDGKVLLRGAQGQVMAPALSVLAPESQALARELSAAAEKAAAQAEQARRAALTPALRAEQIDPRNYFTNADAVHGPYETEAYAAYFVEPNARLLLFVKEGGAFRSEPLRVTPEIFYNNLARAADRHTRRNIKSVAEEPEFDARAGTFRVKRLHDDDVASEILYVCGSGGVTAGYSVEDPPGLKYESSHRFVVSIPKSHLLAAAADGTMSRHHSPRLPPGGGTRADLLASVEGWKVDFRLRNDGGSAKSQASFPYGKSTERLPGGVSSATISGGAYGEASLTVSAAGAGRLSAWIYPSTAPMDGFTMNFTKEHGRSAPAAPAGLLSIGVK